MLYGIGRQLPIVPPILKDLNRPPNPFNILATMAVVNHENDDNYDPQSPEPSEPSPISLNPMNVSTFDSWETSYTTTDDNMFYSDVESRRMYFCHQLLPRRRRPENGNKNGAWECPFAKGGGLSQHICEACGQMIPSAKDIPGPSTNN